MKTLLIIASVLLLAGCNGGAKLPDPTATPFPEPPAELMRPAQTLKTLEPHVATPTP